MKAPEPTGWAKRFFYIKNADYLRIGCMNECVSAEYEPDLKDTGNDQHQEVWPPVIADKGRIFTDHGTGPVV